MSQELQAQNKMYVDQINSLLAQIDALRVQLNETINTCVSLRMQYNLLQKQNQNLQNSLNDANKKLEDFKTVPVDNLQIPTE